MSVTVRHTLYTIPEPCDHLAHYKLTHGVSKYKSLRICRKTRTKKKGSKSETATETETETGPRCSSCEKYEGSKLYKCLVCSLITCSDHALSHSHSNEGHDIALDIERSELYCLSCKDQIYDSDFDSLVVTKELTEMPRNSTDVGLGCRSSKRKRNEVDQGFESSNILRSLRKKRAKSCYPLGLRGLNNVGSSCFMNSVLQALVHVHPLGEYFLGGGHDRDQCCRKSDDGTCLLCEISDVYSAMYSGDRIPFSPVRFLYSWWQHSSILAAYEQQDSHEFFISLLDGIHEKEGRSKSPRTDSRDCQCIAHKVFSGVLRSDVKCLTCGCTSTTYDPCMDISLNIETTNNHSTKDVIPDDNLGISSVVDCLSFFTKSEKLGPDQKLHCRNCREKRDCSKQMSIKKLPLVLCLHIKRFEHSYEKQTSRKIDRYMQFPFLLDMTPYLFSSVLASRFGNRIYNFGSDEVDYSSAVFEIFAMISHSGKLESGHYVTYLRLDKQWYRCDDAWIVQVEEHVVRASQCYMLFYVQKKLAQGKTKKDVSKSRRPSKRHA